MRLLPHTAPRFIRLSPSAVSTRGQLKVDGNFYVELENACIDCFYDFDRYDEAQFNHQLQTLNYKHHI